MQNRQKYKPNQIFKGIANQFALNDKNELIAWLGRSVETSLISNVSALSFINAIIDKLGLLSNLNDLQKNNLDDTQKLKALQNHLSEKFGLTLVFSIYYRTHSNTKQCILRRFILHDKTKVYVSLGQYRSKTSYKYLENNNLEMDKDTYGYIGPAANSETAELTFTHESERIKKSVQKSSNSKSKSRSDTQEDEERQAKRQRIITDSEDSRDEIHNALKPSFTSSLKDDYTQVIIDFQNAIRECWLTGNDVKEQLTRLANKYGIEYDQFSDFLKSRGLRFAFVQPSSSDTKKQFYLKMKHLL